MSDQITERQQQIIHRLGLTDGYSDMIFNLINAVTFAYVGYKQIKNPQSHLVILCFFFGTATLSYAVEEILILFDGFNHFTAANVILGNANNILFCVGHWKFVF